MKKKHLTHSRTGVYNINYHIVWSVKYRRKVITPEIEAYLKNTVQQIADDKGFLVDEFESAMAIMFIASFPLRQNFRRP